MQRFLEIILGLHKGFLSREGEFGVSFNPQWPMQETFGAVGWNLVLGLLCAALVMYVYRHEGRSRAVRIVLGILRSALFALVLVLLNRPVLSLGQSHTEPSVLAVMVDDSLSMRIRDVIANGATPESRLSAAIDLFTGKDQQLLRDLAKVHTLRFYRFDSTATPLLSPTSQPSAEPIVLPVADALEKLEPSGQSTQVGDSLRGVLDDLQGQRLAGIVLLTDGRDTPAKAVAATVSQLKDAGVRIYPVALGSDQPPVNVELQSVTAQDSAFKGDIVNVKATVRATGLPASRDVTVRLRDKKSNLPLLGPDGHPVEQHITLANDQPQETELQFKPDEVGNLDVVVEVEKLAGESDEEDNSRTLQVSVLDAKIALLYVDGYPRWDYRYVKNEMIRDPTVDISCLLTSADPDFRQEGDKPITRFPESINELLDYDVIVFGDVDPRQFSDAQLQMVSEFVSLNGGGFGMVAGPHFSPQAFRGTPIESILPVNISRAATEENRGTISEGFRPVLTKEGRNSSIFRFFADKTRNDRFMHDEIAPIFWYCRNVSVKPGAGEVYAEHPTDQDPENHRAPLLVLGRFGAGRTLFSAIDDSWRWRLYTGESVFDTYWVQQLRYLARGRKLGQRRFSLLASRPTYDLGEQVRVSLRVLDPQLVAQLPEQIRADIRDSKGTLIRQEMMQRQEGQNDLYALSFTADKVGDFSVHIPPIAAGSDEIEAPIRVDVPQLELADGRVDRLSLTQLASLSRDIPEESKRLGKTSTPLVSYDSARDDLPKLIVSAARVTLIESSEPLWDAPLALIIFVFLITTEWLARKVYGMV